MKKTNGEDAKETGLSRGNFSVSSFQESCSLHVRLYKEIRKQTSQLYLLVSDSRVRGFACVR